MLCFAHGALAWYAFERATNEAELLEAETSVNHCFRLGPAGNIPMREISHYADTKIRVLLKRGHEADLGKARTILAGVAQMDPQFPLLGELRRLVPEAV